MLGFSFQLCSPLRARSVFHVYTQLRIAPELWNVITAKGKSAHKWWRFIGDGGKSKYCTIQKNVSRASMLSKSGAILILGGAIPILGGAIRSLNSFSIYKKVIAFLFFATAHLTRYIKTHYEISFHSEQDLPELPTAVTSIRKFCCRVWCAI